MKFRKITALLLVLCMMLSLSISAFAADDVVASGTIQNSGIRWELNGNGWLTISGSGEAPVFQSADDQPWAEYREQITEVWYDDMSTLTISDLAYWFEGCTALTTAELPLAPVIGNHAFYGCDNLNTITMYYGETVLKSIGEDAFWREADAGDTLYIAYIIGYPEATVPFYTYDWAASNRSSRYFYDLYGVYQNADAATTAPSGIKKAPGISVQSTGSIIGNCPSCGKYSFQGTYVEVAHSSRGHANYNECYLCHYVQYLGTYTYKSHGAGGYGSGTCPDCGSHTWVLQSQQAATCTSNGYEKAFLDNPADSFAIYQLRDNDNTAQLRFMNAEYLEKKGLSIEKENYAAVYAGSLYHSGDTQDRLDELYETFNLRRPEEFRGHSLSVSDIVALKQNGVVSCHYVDSRGFKALPDFLKPENYLKNAEMAMEDDYGMIDGVINNGPKQTVAELEEQAKSGKPVSLMELAQAARRELEEQVQASRQEKKPSVLAKLCPPVNEPKKTARSKRAERELL